MNESSGVRPWRSVAFKLSVLSSLFALGVIGLMAHQILRQIERSFLSEMGLRAEFFARSCREALFPRVDAFALHFQVQETVKERAVVYAAVHGPDGRVLSHSEPGRIGFEKLTPQGEAAARAEAPLLQEYLEPRTGERVFDLAVPIRMVSRRVGTARIGFSRASVQEALAGPKRHILVVALAAILTAVLGTTAIVRWIHRPLPRLAAAAGQVARGDFQVHVDWRSQDEIGLTARAFNDMASAVAVLFASLREEKEKIATLFEQTHEGIAWTDLSGRILLLNKSAELLLGGPGRSPATLQEALEGFEAKPPLRSILAGTDRITPCEFHRGAPKLYILGGIAERLGDKDGGGSLLFIFHDATLEKREELLSRNFLSLVSHKLRTPLMVAMGYLDILQPGAEKMEGIQRKALQETSKSVEELHLLVEKLLLYTAAESRYTLQLDMDAMPLGAPVEDALKALSDFLASRKAEVRWDPAALADLPPARADRRLIAEVVKNLVENAVKFDPAPAKTVEISARAEGGLLRLCVRDKGPGIPPEEHEKIFRKFYQVDADFTGQMEGMGLGLALVKNVVEAHGGAVGLVSRPGEGSEFYFTLQAFEGA